MRGVFFSDIEDRFRILEFSRFGQQVAKLAKNSRVSLVPIECQTKLLNCVGNLILGE